MYLCPSCQEGNQPDLPPKGVLKTIYDYEQIRFSIPGKNIFEILQDDHFMEILPINDMKSLPPLKVGNTPLYRFEKLDSAELPFELFLKDD